MKKGLATVAAAALLLGTGGGMAMAQTSNGSGMSNGTSMSPQSSTANSPLTKQDKQFLRQDARMGAYEQALSQAAANKASNQQVKQFAQQDMSDHATLDHQAQQIAQQNNVTLPTQPTKSEQKQVNHLKSLSGSAFDQAYLQDMQSLNRNDMNKLQTEAATTHNQQLKQFAQKAETMDQTHESRAQSLRTAQNDTGSMGGTGVASNATGGSAPTNR